MPHGTHGLDSWRSGREDPDLRAPRRRPLDGPARRTGQRSRCGSGAPAAAVCLPAVDRRPPGGRQGHRRRPRRHRRGTPAAGAAGRRPDRTGNRRSLPRRTGSRCVPRGQSGHCPGAPAAESEALRGGRAQVARLPARLHPAQPRPPRRPGRPAPRVRRSALLPHRRRQDGSLPGTGSLRDRPAPAAPPGRRLPSGRRRVRHHALHPSPADPGPVGACCGDDLRSGTGADRQSGALRRLAVRDRALGRQGGNAQRPGPQGRRQQPIGARQDGSLQARSGPSSGPGSARELPLVRHGVRARLLLAGAGQGQTPQPARDVRGLGVRLLRRPRAADRRRRRTALQAAALLPDRHGRQVRGTALGSTVWRASGRSRPLRRPRFPRRRRAGPRAPSAGAVAGTRSDRPGRTASDRRAARLDDRPLRDCDRGARSPPRRRSRVEAQDRRLHRHDTPSSRFKRSSGVRERRCFRRPDSAGGTRSSLRSSRPPRERRGSTWASRRRAGTRRS